MQNADLAAFLEGLRTVACFVLVPTVLRSETGASWQVLLRTKQRNNIVKPTDTTVHSIGRVARRCGTYSRVVDCRKRRRRAGKLGSFRILLKIVLVLVDIL